MGDVGGREGFERAFATEFDAVHRFIYRRLGREVADELTAETFAIAFARWESYDASRPVRPWLFGIAANLVRHRFRDEERKLRAFARSGVDPVIDEGLEDAAERVDALVQRRTLAAALAELRPREREVLLLRAWAELSDDEIAAALGVPVGSVKTWLSRGRARLRNRLEGFGQESIEEAEERMS